MELPQAVQQQIDAADRMVAEINGNQTEGFTPPETGNQNPPSTDSQVNEPQVNGNTTSQETKPTPEPVPDSKWEAKYHTLKGMYDAEVPRLHAQNRELSAQVQQLTIEFEKFKVQKPVDEPKPKSLITDQDKEAFGPELIDLIERATESRVAEFRAREQELLAKIDKLEGQVGDVSTAQAKTAQELFHDGLTQRVSDWEAMNHDQGFIAWLQEADPLYGVTRQAALRHAYQSMELDRTARFFEAYKALKGQPAPQPQPKPSDDLRSQVAPTRSRSSSAPADTQSKRIYTHADIANFYDEWRRGLISDTDAFRIESDIHAAAAEGRIR